MKALIKFSFIAILLCLMNSCQKEPINSKIEGMWQLETITTLENNETQHCERLYYSITRSVTEVAEKQGTHGYGAFIGRTAYEENERVLILSDFRVRVSTTDDGRKATSEQLKPFGIINPKETRFNVLKSDRHSMILESDYARLTLKKF